NRERGGSQSNYRRIDRAATGVDGRDSRADGGSTAPDGPGAATGGRYRAWCAAAPWRDELLRQGPALIRDGARGPRRLDANRISDDQFVDLGAKATDSAAAEE